MTTLKDIRQQYPQYNDLPDGQLVDAMHRKFYSDIPRADFEKKIGFAPAAATPEVPMFGDLAKTAQEPLVGFNKGLAEVVTMPYRAVDWALENTIGPDYSLPDADKMSIFGKYLKPPAAESTVGKYARAAGEGVGAAAVPMAATMQAASKAAPVAQQATSTLGGIWQGTLDAIRANPGAAVATDLATSGGSGIGAKAAEEQGAGPVGQFAGAVVGGLVPGGIVAYRMPTNTPIGTPTGETMARRRATEAVRDAEAFDNLDVRTFGPAFNQGPVASIAKQTTETPILGAPLRNNFDETMQDAASAATRIASDISPNAMPETAGRNIQRGLERYGQDNIRQINPDRLTDIGINPVAPIAPRSMMSNEAANRLTQADAIRTQERATAYNTAITNGASPADATRIANTQVPALAPGRNQMAVARRGAEDFSDAELSRVVATPSVDTSFRTKQEALYEQAWRMIPNQFRANNTRNPQMMVPVNLRDTLGTIEGQIANQISGQSTIGGPLTDRILGRGANAAGGTRSRPGQFTLPDLRAIRTEIGRSMDEYNPTQQSLSQSQLRQLYGAVSRDIEVGVQDLANRALINSRLPAAAPDHVPPQVANDAARALRYFQRADNYTRAGMERLERFNTVLGTDNPQQAAHRLIAASTDGTRGNMQMVRAAAGSLRPEDRAEFSAMLVQELGRPINSARGIVQEVGWSPNSFVTRYTNMSPEARALFFDQEHRASIDDLFRVANRLSNVESLTNTSRSGTNAINLGGAATAVGSMAAGNFAVPLAIGGSMGATSILMSRPAYTDWMIRYMQLRANVRDGSDRTIAPLLRHVSGLERLTHDNPALWPAYVAVSTEAQDLQKSGKSPSADKKQDTKTADESRILSQARNAISRGAPRNAVEDRLRSMGVDPGKI